jgi:hypothetical protein
VLLKGRCQDLQLRLLRAGHRALQSWPIAEYRRLALRWSESLRFRKLRKTQAHLAPMAAMPVNWDDKSAVMGQSEAKPAITIRPREDEAP